MLYTIYVVFQNDGRFITMEDCYKCDELCSGMIEQVLSDTICWHDIETIDDCKIAYKWLKDHFGDTPEYSFAECHYDGYMCTDVEIPMSFQGK